MTTANEQVALMRQWIEALKSDTYRRGEYLLRNDSNEYCSLGVMCDISGLGRWERISPNTAADALLQDGERWFYVIDGEPVEEDHHQVPPKKVFEHFGFERCVTVKALDADGSVIESDVMDLNDGGRSFLEIAELLEHTYLNVRSKR